MKTKEGRKKKKTVMIIIITRRTHTHKKSPLNIPNIDPNFEDPLVSQDPAELGGEGLHVADMEQI